MDTEIVIVGAGPSGISTGVKLKQAGIDDFVILECSDGVGGTWHNNRYPGLACDVPSLLFSFSYEQKYDWTETHASRAEIRDYLESIVDRYELRDHIRLQSEVTSAAWLDDESLWRIRVADGSEIDARIFVSALGMFTEVCWPDIPGRESFAGTSIHTARWPDDLRLDGKTVAVIGSAASAVQTVPAIAGEVGKLHVFQRTPNWILPKEEEIFAAKELERRRVGPADIVAKRQEIFDHFEYFTTWEDQDLFNEMRDEALANLEKHLPPGELREKLRPTRPFASQRVLFSNDYYPTFLRDNVELVTEPIDRIDQHGILTADGARRDVDVIVYATGYRANKFLSIIDVQGRGGRSLSDDWADGPQAYKGITIPGYPNLFMLYGPNTNQGSLLLMVEYQAEAVVAKIRLMRERGISWIDVRKDAHDAYNEELQAEIKRVGVWEELGSRYYRAASGRNVTQWPLNMTAYRERLEQEDLDAYELATLDDATQPNAQAEASQPTVELSPSGGRRRP